MCNFAAENEKYSINCRQRAGKNDVNIFLSQTNRGSLLTLSWRENEE